MTAAEYMVELLLDGPVRLDEAELRAALRERVGGVEVVDAGERIWVHVAGVRAPRRGVDAPYGVVIEACRARESDDELEAALAQTWDWPEARATVERCAAVMRVRDRFAGELEAARRLDAFHRVVDAVAACAGARAVHWRPSARVIDARAIVRRFAAYGPLGAALNVRQFRVGEGMLLDTVGLAALGLPDVECRFAGVPPERVAALVGGCAEYLVRHGDVIRDGETLDRTAERWTCRRAEAMVGPRRTVLAVEPRRTRRARSAV
ncbi:MAG TPA: DUF4261 domain-containing protein [Polyangia bacterium]|nr:DUF4261 domain-containing protein [Polyangia bacterium]